MRQEISTERRGRKSVWDDLPKLYEEFGGQENFDKLLDELGWLSNWGAQSAAILRSRHEGKTPQEIASALVISPSAAEALATGALRALRDLRGQKLIRIGQVGKASRFTIWNNPKEIMRKYGGPGDDYESRFDNLLNQLAAIEAPWAPGWGKRLVNVIRGLMSGKLLSSIAEEEGRSESWASRLGYEALRVLEALARGEQVTPPRVRRKIDEIFTNRYNNPETFWKLVEELSWSGETFRERNQSAEGAAILRARAEGKRYEYIGVALGISYDWVRQVEAWALENLDRLQRGEEIQFRSPMSTSWAHRM